VEHVFVADTNLFFECKRLEDLPWSDLGCDPIVIALTKPVIGEIDKHKKAGGRTRKRAVEISGRIRGMLETKRTEEIIREAEPKVVLRLLPIVRPDPSLEQDLDYTQNDDRIVGIVSTISRGDGFASVSFLTDDGVAASTAQCLNLPFHLIANTWKRPPEQTTEARQIGELKKDLAAYRSQEPTIELRNASKDETETYTVRRVALALDQSEIDRLVDDLRAHHPLQEDFNAPEAETLEDGTEISYEAPAPEVVQRYTTETYPNWLTQCRSVLETLHGEHETSVKLTFGVTNSGTRPASQMRLSFEALGNLYLRRASKNREDDEADDELIVNSGPQPMQNLPSPPKAPPVQRIVTRPKSTSTSLNTEKLRAGLRLDDPRGLVLGGSAIRGLMGASSVFQDIERMGALSTFARIRQEQDLLFKPLLGGLPDMSHTASAQNFDLAHIYSPRIHQQHDPEGFYYSEWPPNEPVKVGALTCDLFRHRREEEFFEIEVLYANEGNVKGAVLCTIHAENLTEPVELRIPISRTMEEYNLMEAAQAMVSACKA